MNYCVTSKIISSRPDGSVPTFAETLEFVKAAGFDELDYGFKTPELLQDGWQEAFREKLAQAKDAGVRFRYAHMPYDYPSEKTAYGEDEFFLASCRAAAIAVEMGVDCAAIHPRRGMTRGYDAEKEMEQAHAFLVSYRDEAKKAGLILALENMRGPGQSADPQIRRFGMDVHEIITLADRLGIGVCWDTGHGNISGQPQRASILAIGDRLRMVHLNDNHNEDDIHLAPFLGTVKWREAMAALREVGYAGSLNLEVACTRLPEALRESYAAYMGKTVRELEKYCLEG